MATVVDVTTLNWAKCWDFQNIGQADPNTGVVRSAPEECERAVIPNDWEEGEYEFDGTLMYMGPGDILIRHLLPNGDRERYEGHTRDSYEANFRRVSFPTGV